MVSSSLKITCVPDVFFTPIFLAPPIVVRVFIIFTSGLVEQNASNCLLLLLSEPLSTTIISKGDVF